LLIGIVLYWIAWWAATMHPQPLSGGLGVLSIVSSEQAGGRALLIPETTR
jgi:hypothetical protein